MTLYDFYLMLRTSHVQTQGIVDTLREPLVVLNQNFEVVNANPAFYRVFQTDRDETLGRTIFDLGDGQWDIPDLRVLLRDVVPKSAAIIGFQVSHDFPGLGQRTMLISARQLVHPDNNSSQMLVVFDDVTTQQKAQMAKDILVAETNHRMKNLVTILRAVAHQTESEGRTGTEYRHSFMGRFEAVLNAQAFVTANGSNSDLAGVIAQALEAVPTGQAVVTPGPSIHLTAHQVMPVSMILHELATNAMKYGAWSLAGGLVHINWSEEHANGQGVLTLDWREEGGPSVSIPTRRGFGTELIEYTAKAEGGGAVFDFDPTGLHARITVKLEQ